MKHGTFSDAEYSRTTKNNSGPTIKLNENGFGAPGMYIQSERSDVVTRPDLYIHPIFLEEVESILSNSKSTAVEKQGALLALYNVILHETTHYGKDISNTPQNTTGIDSGNEWEIDLWGRDLGEQAGTMPYGTTDEVRQKMKSYIQDCIDYAKNAIGTDKENLLPTL
jgi:hypothetical protein